MTRAGRGDISAIVLAGGRSSRFGGSKLDADLGGRTVLERTIEVVGAISTEVIVVGRSAPPDAGSTVLVRYMEDRAPFDGPLAGLLQGLMAAAGDHVVVIGGDMPFARPRVLRRMLHDLVAGDDIEAIVLVENGAPRPLPIVVRRLEALVVAETARGFGERSLRQLLARLRVEALGEIAWRELDPEADTLFDVDTPADLDRARQRLAV